MSVELGAIYSKDEAASIAMDMADAKHYSSLKSVKVAGKVVGWVITLIPKVV